MEELEELIEEATLNTLEKCPELLARTDIELKLVYKNGEIIYEEVKK